MQSDFTWKSLAIFTLVTGLAGLWLANAPSHDEAVFPMPRGKTLVNECGRCHAAYAPGLLPARSWRKMMDALDDHFGEDASVLEPVSLALLKDLEDMAADGAFADMRMRRIAGAVPVDEAPQRVTETAYFKAMHASVPKHYWKNPVVGSPGNCGACHPGANEGRFSELELGMPGSLSDFVRR
ncbi:MAG: cytochrome C [Pseudomonadota bacterium]|nr:cytochrome C [Pseudomonadota bacterium]MDP1903004.1 cytochrome C [Pseudomonadota bacterium]MDP2352224.1 cytochrome C [Pseudomonadota bacterium]